MKGSLIFLLCFFLLSASGNAQIITTVAGNGTFFLSTYSGDGGPATNASLWYNWDAVPDATGNVYLSDWSYSRIRKVNTAGIINLFGGTGSTTSGDGGPATAAGTYVPQGMVMDGAGNLYICQADHRIRKINTSGIISTIGGTGTAGFSGDGGPATLATFHNPYGIAIDGTGNLYICDFGNSRIRKISTSGIVSTVAGNGTSGYVGDGGPATAAELVQPGAVAVDNSGNLYVTEWSGAHVREVNSSGIISTFAGTSTSGFSGDGGPATAAEFNGTVGVATDAAGNVYVGDRFNYRIRKINTAGIVSTIAGTGTAGYSGDGGPATAAEITYCYCLHVDPASQFLYLPDIGGGYVRKISISVIPLYFTGGHNQALNVCENSTGNSINALLAAADTSIGHTETWSLIWGPSHGVATVSYTTLTTGGILTPAGLSYTPASGYYGNDTFTVRVTNGTFSDTTTIAVTVARFDAGIISGALTVCPGNTITLSDTTSGGAWSSSNTSVATVSSSGVVSGVAAGNAILSYTVTNSCGTVSALYPVAVGIAIISRFAGSSTGSLGDGGPATSATLYLPTGICTDGSGNTYIADNAHNRIRKVDNTGIITTVAGTGTAGFSGDGGPATAALVNGPYDVAKDAAGNVYFSDLSNQRIRKINTSGIISTIAGNGTAGYSGDGGPGTAAHLESPGGLTMDGSGNLYIGEGAM